MSGHNVLMPALCANPKCTSKKTSLCEVNITCQECLLVLYCSNSCKEAHLTKHRCDCKSPLRKETWKPDWDRDGRLPSFVSGGSAAPVAYGEKKYLWGNMPAVDLLNLEKNEGRDLQQDIRLLFPASGDIRNVVKSLNSLPETYQGKCEIMVNDKEFDIVARNAIILLIAFHFPPEIAAITIIHIWYSALLPKETLQMLQKDVLPLIEDVCEKISSKPPNTLLSKAWSYHKGSIRLVLKKVQWNLLREYFKAPTSLSAGEAQNIRRSTVMPTERKDYLQRGLYTQLPSWRVCMMKFRNDGILLPFGSPREGFDTPNPTFYQRRSWPMMDSADPLFGWSRGEVINRTDLLSKHDIYGSLFFYLHEMLLDFCRQLQNLEVHVQLFQVDARELPGLTSAAGGFDRIEASNLGDRCHLGIETTLATFGPLLKLKSQNPKATLLVLFLNAVEEVQNNRDSMGSMVSNMNRMSLYFPQKPNLSKPYGADFLSRLEASTMFRDVDVPFQRYMDVFNFNCISREQGLAIKSENTIISPWPMRPQRETGKAEFKLLEASGATGSERYMEWVRE